MSEVKKILITGAGGFVGKRLSKELALQGHEVFALMREIPNQEDMTYFKSELIHIIIHDLENFNPEKLPRNVDKLITLAQSAHFRDFPKKAEEVFRVNTSVNLSLLQWAISNSVKKVVHVSSGGIYGGKFGKIFQENELLSIDTPLGFYLGSKLCSEIIFQNYMNFFETAVILRPFFIYGPGQRKDMLIARLTDSVRKGKQIQLQGESGLRLNPVYVEDAAIVFANSLNLTGKHIINVAGPDILTLKKISEYIGHFLHKEPVFEHKEGDVVDYVGNIEQAVKKLDHPMTSFLTGLEQTLSPS